MDATAREIAGGNSSRMAIEDTFFGARRCGGSSALQWLWLYFLGIKNGSRICESGLCTPFFPAISAVRWSIGSTVLCWWVVVSGSF